MSILRGAGPVGGASIFMSEERGGRLPLRECVALNHGRQGERLHAGKQIEGTIDR